VRGADPNPSPVTRDHLPPFDSNDVHQHAYTSRHVRSPSHTVTHGRHLLFEWPAAWVQPRAPSYAVRRGGPATFTAASHANRDIPSFAIKQPSAGAGTDDCFSRHGGAELTIELATFQSPRSAPIGVAADDRLRPNPVAPIRAAGRRTPGGMPGAGCCFQLARANRSACANAWDERRRPSSGARSRRSRPPRCLHARAQPSDLRRPCVKHKRRSRRRGCLARAGTIATGGKQKSRAVGAA